jgi:hypothetical protein
MTSGTSASERFCVRLSPALIEGFLACYGDADRFPRDSHRRRRADVKHASKRLFVAADKAGRPALLASRTNPDHEASLYGFLEVYEAGSNLGPSDIARRLSKLRVAVTLFLQQRDD